MCLFKTPKPPKLPDPPPLPKVVAPPPPPPVPAAPKQLQAPGAKPDLRIAHRNQPLVHASVSTLNH